ncbi:hypothetical protein QJ857_gp0300 [Tupanvirus soda lake]|uniref:Uncharacterized protein n=2 Tax=Tupanvirus TaxID=2094720 RepID=A0A6N1NWS9_9VIRU|nr:hypothetical protein QJ857_gp0300 [Tupanvirus soda lake]QKU35728.1 hypothetical protein [Tupanvirus soda lake]
MNIEEIIHLVINGKLTTKKIWYPTGRSSSRDEGKALVEPVKELKGVMTDLVVYEFLKTPLQLCNFISLVFTTFDQAIKTYNKAKGFSDKDIFFVYKGGNILRFISNKVFYMLPGRVKDDMFSYYRDAFKKSDADFSIYINPLLDNFDQAFDEITIIAYFVQNYLRNIFLENPKKYFDYYNLSDSAKRDLYLTYLDKLNNAEVVKTGVIPGKFLALWTPDVDIGKKYIPKKDFEIFFEKIAKILQGTNNITKSADPNKKSITTFVNLKPIHLEEFEEKELANLAESQLDIYGNISQSEIIVSVNRTTTFLAHGGIVSFNLVRTKVSFNAIRDVNLNSLGEQPPEVSEYLVDRLDGELIDVSITNKQDYNVKHFFENVDKYIVEYKLEEGECNMPFRAYSIDYLIEDLENILFVQNEYPWDDPKYAKRLKRLIFMYYLSLFLSGDFENNRDRIRYLYSLKKLVLEPISNMQSSASQLSTNTSQLSTNTSQLSTNTSQLSTNTSQLSTNTSQLSTNLNTDEQRIRRENNLAKILSFVIAQNEKYPNLTAFKNLINRVFILYQENDAIHSENYNKFVNAIIENINILQKSLVDLEKYISSSGTIDEDKLYTGQIGGRRNDNEQLGQFIGSRRNDNEQLGQFIGSRRNDNEQLGQFIGSRRNDNEQLGQFISGSKFYGNKRRPLIY